MTTPAQTLLAAKGQASAAQSKSVQLHPFTVPDGVPALALRFDFGPRLARDLATNERLVEGAIEEHLRWRSQEEREARATVLRRVVKSFYSSIPNLLNVVLIDPQGRWRGRWDQNPISEKGALLLAPDLASKGFYPGPLTPGTWQAALEIHGVFGEPVSWELNVEARPLTGPERASLSAQLTTKTTPPPRRTGDHWYFGEMHSHTYHSDGEHELADMVEKAVGLGMDFVCLTDHNTTSGLRERTGLPLAVIDGCELTTYHGHHPVYGFEELLPWHVEGRVRPIEELSVDARRLGGLVSLAHPFRLGDPLCTGCRMRPDIDPACLDLMEIWYRRWDARDTDNEAAHALWNRWWREGRRITAVGARDWHNPSHEAPFPGPLPLTGVRAKDPSRGSILEGLRRGEVIVSGGPICDLWLEGPRGRTGIGGTLRGGGPVRLGVELERVEAGSELRLFASGEKVRTLEVDRDGIYEFDDVAHGPGWYRAEIWREGLPRVFTNHVVLERP